MILYINGSPSMKRSSSNYFLNKIKNEENIFYLYESFRGLKKKINKCDTIVLAFPLYVDSPPNKVIEFMEYIESNNISIKDKNIYVIVNSGFLEPHQNQTAVDIIKTFALNNKANYKGSFKIGAGCIVSKKAYRIITLPFLFKSRKFKKAIDSKSYIELSTTLMFVWKRLYVYLANKSWRKKIKYYQRLKQD